MRPEFFTRTLLFAIDDGQIMVSGLHGPYFIPLAAERLRGIGAYPRIHNYRLSVVIKDKVACIVVIVTLIVMSTFGSKIESLRRSLLLPGTGYLRTFHPKTFD